MNKPYHIFLLVIFAVSCTGKTQKNAEISKNQFEEKLDIRQKPDSTIVEKAVENAITEKDSTTDFHKLPDFDEYFEIVWQKQLDEDANYNDYIIRDSVLFSPFLIQQFKAINIKTGELVNVSEHLITDSLFRIKKTHGEALIDVKNEKVLFETNYQIGLSNKPELIPDSLTLFKVGRNKVSLFDYKNRKTIWTIDSLESRIIRSFLLDSVVVIYMKEETQVVDKYSGSLKWSENGNYYFTNDLVSNNQMILIHEKKGHMLKVNPSNGDTLLIQNFKNEYKSHTVDNKTLYYIDDSTITSFDIVQWKINWSNKGNYYRIQSDNNTLYTFESGKLHKIDKSTGETIWKTLDADYGSQIIPAQSYVITELFGMQENGCPVIIDKKIGQPLAMHCDNLYHDENNVMLSKINIYLYRSTPVFGDMILAGNFANHKTTYTLIKKSR